MTTLDDLELQGHGLKCTGRWLLSALFIDPLAKLELTMEDWSFAHSHTDFSFQGLLTSLDLVVLLLLDGILVCLRKR